DTVAAGRLEGEDIVLGPAGAVEEALPELALGAVQAHLDRRLGDAEGLADLVGGHALDLAQEEDRAVDLGKLGEGGLEQGGELSVAELRFGAARRAHQFLPSVLLVAERRLGEAPARAQPVDRRVDRDAHQPGRDLRPLDELAEVQESAKIRLLHDVLALRLVAEERAHGAVDPLVVATHEYLEEIPIARAHARDDLLVRQISDRIHPTHRRTSLPKGYRLFLAEAASAAVSSSKNICGTWWRSTPNAPASSCRVSARRLTRWT